jgi:hypothetical protein
LDVVMETDDAGLAAEKPAHNAIIKILISQKLH